VDDETSFLHQLLSLVSVILPRGFLDVTAWGVCLPDDRGLKAVDDETSFLYQLLSLVSVILPRGFLDVSIPLGVSACLMTEG